MKKKNFVLVVLLGAMMSPLLLSVYTVFKLQDDSKTVAWNMIAEEEKEKEEEKKEKEKEKSIHTLFSSLLILDLNKNQFEFKNYQALSGNSDQPTPPPKLS